MFITIFSWPYVQFIYGIIQLYLRSLYHQARCSQRQTNIPFKQNGKVRASRAMRVPIRFPNWKSTRWPTFDNKNYHQLLKVIIKNCQLMVNVKRYSHSHQNATQINKWLIYIWIFVSSLTSSKKIVCDNLFLSKNIVYPTCLRW